MPHLGAPEMIFILVVVLLVFGAGRLPEVGRSMGKAITEFKSGLSGLSGTEEKPNVPSQQQPPALPPDRGEAGSRSA